MTRVSFGHSGVMLALSYFLHTVSLNLLTEFDADIVVESVLDQELEELSSRSPMNLGF